VIADGAGRARSSTSRAAGRLRLRPYFLCPLGKTAAELTAAEKNAVSHRGQALRALVEKLK
jgi:XTP/dITP diphosphohydrolase